MPRTPKFNVLKFYALWKDEYPVHYEMALCVYGVVLNEANVERVFSFSSRTLDDRRLLPICVGAVASDEAQVHPCFPLPVEPEHRHPDRWLHRLIRVCRKQAHTAIWILQQPLTLHGHLHTLDARVLHLRRAKADE